MDLYRKQRPRFDIANMELRMWQNQTLNLIDKPTERQVIWITGRQGNEGKTWFQCYAEAYFGFHRVVRLHAYLPYILKLAAFCLHWMT